MVPFLSESGKQFLGMYPTVYLGIYLLAKFDTVFLSWSNDSQNIFASFLTIKILFKAVYFKLQLSNYTLKNKPANTCGNGRKMEYK